MPSRRIVSEPGEEYYLVRIALPGSMLHLASTTEPMVQQDDAGRVIGVEADWIDLKGDTIGFVDWSAVIGVTWRWTGESAPVDLFGPIRRRSAPDLDEAGSQLPPPVDPWPTLLPEYRLAFVLSSGFVHYTPVISEQECVEITSRLRYARWRLERRMCSPWVAAGPNMQTTVTVEPIDSIPEFELRPQTAENGTVVEDGQGG